MCPCQSYFGRFSSHLRRRRLPIDAKQRLTLEARRRHQVAKHLRLEEVIAHQQRKALTVEVGTRGEHGYSVLFVPVLVDAEIKCEAFGRAGGRDFADAIGIEPENQMRMSETCEPDGHQCSKQQRRACDGGEEFRPMSRTSKAIAVSGG